MKQLFFSTIPLVLVIFVFASTANAQSPEVTGEEGMESNTGCTYFVQPQTVTEWTNVDAVETPKATFSQPNPYQKPMVYTRLVVKEVKTTNSVSGTPTPNTFTFTGVAERESDEYRGNMVSATDRTRRQTLNASVMTVNAVNAKKGDVYIETINVDDPTQLVVQVMNFTKRPKIELRFRLASEPDAFPATIAIEVEPEEVANHITVPERRTPSPTRATTVNPLTTTGNQKNEVTAVNNSEPKASEPSRAESTETLSHIIKQPNAIIHTIHNKFAVEPNAPATLLLTSPQSLIGLIVVTTSVSVSIKKGKEQWSKRYWKYRMSYRWKPGTLVKPSRITFESQPAQRSETTWERTPLGQELQSSMAKQRLRVQIAQGDREVH